MVRINHYSSVIFVLLGLFFFSKNSSALPTQQICITEPVSSGWVITGSRYNAGICNTPYPPLVGQDNVYTITNVSNLPLNSTAYICATQAAPIIPPGWSYISSHPNDGSCGCPWGTGPGGCDATFYQSNRFLIKHTACLSPPSPGSCPVPPPDPTGTLSTSASSVTIPYGQTQGAVTVSWTVSNTSGGCIWQSTSGAAPALWLCGGISGSSTWSHVPAGGNTKFILTTNGSTPSPVLATKTVTGIAGAQPTLKLVPKYNLVQTGTSSGNVLIPATASPTSGPFTFSWTGPGYPSLDLQGQINGGAWLSPLNIPASGSSDQPIPLGTTYTYRLLPHGATSPVLATLSVTGVAAPAPTFSINPAHVVVPPGASEGSFTFTWNAPGYEALDLAGQVNGGAWGTPFAIPKSGSSTQPIPVGTTYNYRFYPPGDTVHIIGTLSVSASR